MNAILTLVRKDFALLLKDRTALVIAFAVPFVMIYLFGLVFNVNGKDTGPSGVPIGIVNQSDNPAAKRLVDGLRTEKTFRLVDTFTIDKDHSRPLAEDDLKGLMRADRFRFALVIPKDLIRPDELGLHLKIYSNPRNEIEAQTVNGILQQAIFTHVPELLGQSLQERARRVIGDERLGRFDSAIASAVAQNFGGDQQRILDRIRDGHFGVGAAGAGQADDPQAASDQVRSVLNRIIRIDTVQVAGKDVSSPAATLLVGGWAIQFLLFAVSASAVALFRERDAGIFQRLLSSPVSRGDILWSKFLYGVSFGVLQLMVLFAAGQILYGVDVAGHLPMLVLVCVFASSACTAFGLLIASLSPSPDAARGLSTLTILLMSAIGGAWFPVSFMPEFIQKVSKLTLVYWSMEGFSQVLWSHASLLEMLPTLGWLALTAALVGSVAMWRFRTGRIFE